ncbi:PREDICTED: E3 ubiquitin/ISG15 ligase TRIM25-like [Nanorana parkeri]|uniref:E3 ubiquitin/ISG15 ligase TRIM25-like n=1 Tax=Nanorana parkeri TaxID=125878 RepID=UPI000854F3A7|nr:PREDICTED: E3 ubiquitin/ISG15 ligase TRIM25-like [Nanorana parkeri]
MVADASEPIYSDVEDIVPDTAGSQRISNGYVRKNPPLWERKSEPSKPAVPCTYCIYSAVPAIKSCLLCEASLCLLHLQVHSKSPEHVLTIPLSNPGGIRDLKCSTHKEAMKYYCYEDSACICVSCCFAGQHKGHQVELLEVASGKKKKDLRNLLERLNSRQNRIDNRVLRLKQQRGEVQDRTAVVTERVVALFNDLRRQLEELEKRLLCEISAEGDRITRPFTLLINQLQTQQDELYCSIMQIEQLINLSDPLAIMAKTSAELEPKDTENLIYNLEEIDEGLISVALHRSFNEIMQTVKMAQGSTDLLLDVESAANDVYLSGDKKTVSWSKINQRRPKHPTRFKSLQVLSKGAFSFGRHYWEVQTSETGEWMMGVCYPSMERKGTLSVFGSNNRSWCLSWRDKKISVVHDQKVKHFLNLFPCHRVGIYLDYEAGRLSFYKLDDPVRHLHTFMVNFTDPLFAAFSVQRGWLRIKT